MECKFIWYNLPQGIKRLTGESITWFNLPKRLNDIYAKIRQSKNCPNLPLKEDYIWFNLPKKLKTLCEVINCPPLNEWTYPEGQAPSLEDFEAIVGFPLLNGQKVGDTITFDNTGYDLPDSAFSFAETISIISKCISAGVECFIGNTGFIHLTDCINIGSSCFESNSGTIIADKVEIISGVLVFASNSGTISIKSLTPIGATVGNNGQMSNATNTAVFNVNIANATNNGGNPDGDIQVAMIYGTTVNYFEYP
jgi:hypothetical protein